MRKASFALLLFFFLSISLVASAPCLAIQAPQNTWETRTPMPTPRSGFGLVAVNGSLYAIGGYNKNQGDFSAANEKYDPATGNWTKKADMPTHRVSFGMVAYQNKIYVFGGQILVNGHRVVVNVSEAYDPATDTWKTLAPMPHLGEDFAAYCVVGDKIYLVSTYNDVYDPASDSWTTKAAIPNVVAHSANAEVDGKIYVISGTHYGNEPQNYAPINLTQIYDPASDSWSNGAPIPLSIASPAAASTVGVTAPKAIYVIGGLQLTPDNQGSFIYYPQNLTQVYFPSNNSWSAGAAMPTARYALAVAALNDQIYAMGGSDARTTPDLGSNEFYLPLGYGTLNPSGFSAISFTVVAVVAVVGAVVILAVVLIKYRKTTNPKRFP